jgi:hypothetical protein
MKKHFLSLFILLVVMGSCENPPISSKDAIDIPLVERGKVITVTIEECEYLSWRYDRSLGITHKGNCHNPIHSLPDNSKYWIVDKTTGKVINPDKGQTLKVE